MFKWLDRRKRMRREDDLRIRMEEAANNKKKLAEEATAKLNQVKLFVERRLTDHPVDLDRRQPA